MPSSGFHRQLKTQIAFLGDADQRRRRGGSRKSSTDNVHSLVKDVFQLDAARAQQLGDFGGAVVAADLFVVTECEVDRPLRLEACAQEIFDSFKYSQHADLIVHRAASPEVTVGDFSREGRMGPLPLGW